MSEYEMLLLFKLILDSTAQNRLQNVKLLLSDDTLKVTWTVEGKEKTYSVRVYKEEGEL